MIAVFASYNSILELLDATVIGCNVIFLVKLGVVRNVGTRGRRSHGQGCRGGGRNPFSYNYERLWGLSPFLQTPFRLDKFITAFSKGAERKSTLLSIEEECYKHTVAFSFYYFRIHWFDKHIIVKHTKMGLFESVIHTFPTTGSLLLQF